MKITHSGITYDCTKAVKCEYDRYIKLYDENGVEIVAFHGITDFEEYEISGGSFVDPCNGGNPIALSVYAIGGRTISTNDWILSDSGEYQFEINNSLISANKTTCNILLLFAPGTEFEYSATQEEGKIIISTGDSAPLDDIVIDGIQITRA